MIEANVHGSKHEDHSLENSSNQKNKEDRFCALLRLSAFFIFFVSVGLLGTRTLNSFIVTHGTYATRCCNPFPSFHKFSPLLRHLLGSIGLGIQERTARAMIYYMQLAMPYILLSFVIYVALSYIWRGQATATDMFFTTTGLLCLFSAQSFASIEGF